MSAEFDVGSTPREVLARYRRETDGYEDSAVVEFNQMTVDDRLELLFHGLQHLTATVAEMLGQLVDEPRH